LLHAAERPTSIKEPFMATDYEPKPPTTIKSTPDSNRSDSGDDAMLIRWIPVVVPLLALLPVLAVYFIGWGVLAGTH
jgi:hypothetical protein